MARAGSQRGFGVIEVLASVAIFALVAAALSASTVSGMKANHTSRNVAAASTLIYDKIDELRSLNPGHADLLPGSHSDPLNPLTGLGETRGLYTLTWVVTANTPRPGVSRVDLTVSWRNPEQRTLKAVTFACASKACVI